ncbi:hypothetical protein NOR53_2774 [gamma proteobacterium NOR5-3]|nr:hypothetical protein NOR53_2774 [gamma proteobacterium NOR5-3]
MWRLPQNVGVIESRAEDGKRQIERYRKGDQSKTKPFVVSF